MRRILKASIRDVSDTADSCATSESFYDFFLIINSSCSPAHSKHSDYLNTQTALLFSRRGRQLDWTEYAVFSGGKLEGFCVCLVSMRLSV